MKKLKILLQSNYLYIGLFIILFFFVYIKTKVFKYQSKIDNDTRKIVATIESFKIDGDKISFQFKGEERFVGNYYISSETEKNYWLDNLAIGMKVEITGEKSELLNNTIPNTFNYKKYLYNKKIYFSFSIEKITILEAKISLSNRLKNVVLKRIKKLDNNPYLEAFILGDKSLMQNDVQENIRDNGVSHLFALSGMHLSFIYVFLEKVLKKIKFHKIIIYAFLVFYLVLASFPVSFIRAILFTALLDIDKLLAFNISKIKILFLIAIFLLFYNPFYIYDLGFIYTFVVTFSLLSCHKLLQKKGKFMQIFMVSLITFLFSMPITIYTSYEINLFSIINNIILVPFVSMVVFPLAIITFIFSFLLPIFIFFTKILENLNGILKCFSLFFVFGKINLVEVLIYYILLIIILKIKVKFIIVFLIYLLFLYNKDIFIQHYSVYFLDVGQGDSALLVSPKNKEVILVDTGGKLTYKTDPWKIRNKEFNLSDNIIQFLKSKRIRKIDLLLITHGDYDHMGEAINLVNNFKAEKVIFNCGSYNDLENELIKLLKEKQIKYNSCVKQLNIGDNQLYFLNTKEYDNENDNSNVVYTEFNNYKFLFMGDASTLTEKEILNKYNLSNIDVLKVGHHGSKTSSSKEFINTINPKYSLISVGKNNRYGHPNKEVLENLENSIVYRTDIDGSFMFEINNKKLKIETYPP